MSLTNMKQKLTQEQALKNSIVIQECINGLTITGNPTDTDTYFHNILKAVVTTDEYKDICNRENITPL